MSHYLVDKKIALLGGDDREKILLSSLEQSDAQVQVLGQPFNSSKLSREVITSLAQIDANIDAVIAPMTGVDENYKIKKTFIDGEVLLTEDFFAGLQPGTKFFIGFAKPKIKEWCKKYNLDLIELATLDELAILNAIPTAEGAINKAIEHSRITLHHNNSFVLGLGRVGMTIARMLEGMGSNTFGVARKPKDLARALEMGLEPVEFQDLKQEIVQADFIFNTVPTLVLDREILSVLDSETVIIDVASAPGGTDFAAAKDFGISAHLALGLPGKVAPKSAGEILGDIIPRFIEEK
ncbi:dipicolinate synthase subunit DpsA [Halanaerobacter jeridensis]|uniref:Dipicolinate synthase subunit A n=1 Tax=Halanaerobacter jeridensis TaxID=706427 RepID=A0A938XU84_9FIRM|nr:dipicolinate synthase subunit DpsA [Halanaerobacter jeridensis]MBM7557866.1 dipicolinate synthase subunit A [Halanaerobacter jeridensis]